MTCQETTQKLSAFLDGELPDVERTLVGRHLDICEACAAESRILAYAWEQVAELPRVGPRAHLWPSIESRLGHSSDQHRWRWFAWRPVPALAALASLVGLLLGFQVGDLVVNRVVPDTRRGGESEADPLHVAYFGDVFPGSLPDAVLNIGVDARSADPEGMRR